MTAEMLFIDYLVAFFLVLWWGQQCPDHTLVKWQNWDWHPGLSALCNSPSPIGQSLRCCVLSVPNWQSKLGICSHVKYRGSMSLDDGSLLSLSSGEVSDTSISTNHGCRQQTPVVLAIPAMSQKSQVFPQYVRVGTPVTKDTYFIAPWKAW